MQPGGASSIAGLSRTVSCMAATRSGGEQRPAQLRLAKKKRVESVKNPRNVTFPIKNPGLSMGIPLWPFKTLLHPQKLQVDSFYVFSSPNLVATVVIIIELGYKATLVPWRDPWFLAKKPSHISRGDE